MKKLLLFICLVTSLGMGTKALAQNNLDNAGLSTTSARGAYSLRKLSSTYTGFVLKARRVSDNAEANIAFNGSGTISGTSVATITAAGTSGLSVSSTLDFSSFYAGTDVRVMTWYDQSGNSNHITQTVTASMPKIVTAGVINLLNGKPALNFATVNMNIPISCSLLNAQGSIAAVHSQPALQGNYAALLSWQAAIGVGFGPLNSAGQFGLYNVNNFNSAPVINTNVAINTTYASNATWTNSNANVTESRNKSASTGSLAYRFSATVATGTLGNNGGFFVGDVPELIIFSTPLTTIDRQALENNQFASFTSNLSALTTTAGVISPAFSPATTAYTASVPTTTTSVTVTPTVADATATVQVRVNVGTYTTVTSGNASSALSLNVGSNTIDVKVTAQDGTTIKTYTTTVTRAVVPPTIDNFTATSGPVGTLVTITGTNLTSPTGISIGGVVAIPISNTGTSLVAMVMPGAATGAVIVTTAGGTANGTGNFIVTASQASNAQQGSKLVGTGGSSNAQQGYSLSISADGNTAIVGGHLDNSNAGAAWVYTRSGGVWAQQGTKLVGTGAVGNAYQGCSVSISADGNTAMVGGYADNSKAGAAWIYTRSGGTWTQQGNKLLGTGAVGNAHQGISVSLSADGNTAMVGGHIDNSGAGAAWVYTRSGGVWAQQGTKLVGTGAVGTAYQGWSVSISADGNTAMVGGDADNSNAGAAWVYTRSGGVWAQQGNKLVGTGSVGAAEQGWSVSLSADGNTVIMGGRLDNSNAGAAWVYTYVPPLPVILSFTPTSATTGATVNITGTNFTSASAVSFGGTAATSFSVVSATSITAVVANGTSGSLSVTTPSGTGTLAGFTYLSSNADLSVLTINAGTLSPTFTSGTTSYSASVTNATTSITLTPTRVDANATITVNGTAVSSGTASDSIALNVGSNTITTIVTAQDGTTIKIYTITVTREAIPPGKTLSFNGTNQSVTVNNTLGNFGTGDFTIEAWFKTTSAGPGSIVSKRISCGSTDIVSITISSSILNMEISGSSVGQYTVILGRTNVADGKWHHVAAQRAGSVVKLFLDGVSDASNVAVVGSPTLINSANFIIGNTSCNYYFNGSIDEVRVYNAALTQANIQADMFSTASSVPASLQAYYNFDASSGTVLTDQTANGNNGTLVNSPTWTESYAMVVPTAIAATSLGSASFTANWTAPVVGTVDNGYKLDVSKSSTFASFVSGYNGLTVAGLSQAVTGLTGNTTYYYRVRADKTSVTGQGGNSSSISVLTLSTNANLSALTLSEGSLSPSFAANTITYTSFVGSTVNNITITPTNVNANATIQVRINGGTYTTVTSGAVSGSLTLNEGDNTVDVKVTAEDATTTKTYSITVTKATVLPVSFISFDAKLTKMGSVDLTWLTATEKDNSHFVVLKSIDGVNFSEFAKVNGNGDSNQQNRYQTTDRNPVNGNNYYRLVQYDVDGKATILSTRVVNVNLDDNRNVTVYPNPAQEAVNVKFAAGIFNSVKLIDMTGKVLIQKSIDKGNSAMSLAISSLPSGSYIIRLEGKAEIVNTKLIKK